MHSLYNIPVKNACKKALSMYSSLRIFWRMLQLWLFESDLKVIQGDCAQPAQTSQHRFNYHYTFLNKFYILRSMTSANKY